MLNAAAVVVETDALVIGAGPVGLFQVFQLGLLEITAHVVDCLPHVGGQCVELYGDKPIYDIPAVPVCTGRELTQMLVQQIAPFEPSIHLNQVVTALKEQADGRYLLATSKGLQFLAKTVFIAAGVGAFQHRTLPLAGIDELADGQLLHDLEAATGLANQRVVIVGSDDNALDCAFKLCRLHEDGYHDKAASVTLVHRRDVLAATPERIARFQTLCDTGAIRFIAGQVTGLHHQAGVLTEIDMLGQDNVPIHVPLDRLVVMLGLSPKLGPLAQWGLAMERRQLQVDTESFSTSARGVFAVGDINTYPGKKKLILCGFHEATLAAYAAAAIVFPQRPTALQYTTTSTRLHTLLGVAHRSRD